MFNQLTNRDVALIDDDEIVYFRDIYDHVIRLTDELDNYRELASATLDVYLTQVNNNLSVIMKRLTGVTVILAGIGAIAGIFGMSEAGTALGGGEAGGFWLDHRDRGRDGGSGRRRSCARSTGSRAGYGRRPPGAASGGADAWSEASCDSGSATTWSLPDGAAPGPPTSAARAARGRPSRRRRGSVWWRRTSVISYRNRWSSLVQTSTTIPISFLPFWIFDWSRSGRNMPCRAWA